MKTFLASVSLILFLALPGVLAAQEEPPPPPPAPPAPAEPAPALAIPVAEPQGFSAAVVNEETVAGVNGQLKGICLAGPYTIEFKLVLEDDDADEVVLKVSPKDGDDEIYEVNFDSEGKVEIDGNDDSEEEDLDIDEDDKVRIKLIRRGQELSLYSDGDDVIENEELLEESDQCHVLSFTVEEEFYIEALKLMQGVTN